MEEFLHVESDNLEYYKNIYLKKKQKLDSKKNILKSPKPIPNLRKTLSSLKKSLDKNSPKAEAENLKKCLKAIAYRGSSKRMMNILMKQLGK